MNETISASIVCGTIGAPNSLLAVVGEDRVLEQQQGLLGEPVDLPGRLADHVAAHQDVADQAAFLGVLRLDRVIVQLAELADVVEDRRGHDDRLVQGRIQAVVILRVVVGQEPGDPGHAPDVLEQAAVVAVVEVRGRLDLAEQLVVLVQDRQDESA